MNQRVLELIEESRDWIPSQQKLGGGMYIPGPMVRGDINLQKFTELIIADCTKLADELQEQYLTNRKEEMDFYMKSIYAEGESACDILKHKIRKQFGVEK